MADLGNLMFRMGLNTKEFEKQMADELQLAKKTADEIKKMFADIKLPQMGGKGGKGGAGGGGADNDKLEITSDLYKKLANRMAIVAEQQKKLQINSKFGYNGQYVKDAIDKLEQFKEKLQSGLLSGSKKTATDTMKLFSNQDYALLNKQVENMIREGDKYNRSQERQAAAQKKAQEEMERQKVTMGSLVAQYNKLTEAVNKVNFAQSHTNKSGVNAGGALTNNARTGLLNAQAEITKLINLMNAGGNVSRSQIQVAMEGATRAIRESSTAIQQQRAINTEAQRAQMSGQAQILARQRAINAAQAENARLIARSNSHFSIMRNLVGQVGSMMGMYFSAYALQNFIQDLVRIRGEFDAQYTALKAILQSGQQASELFSQLKTLAPISPYQFKDLATYAKQISAYSIPYNELFDTTKRLADLSSGLGVDFYRIVLAYGQVRSAAVLRGQELRQFTEAGIPMVDELAKKFTKLKGEVVSAGDVFELISERQVPFQMVKEVIDDLTNEGGKFYMMQEKQSETLKGKVSNLADRYDIMMNSLGEANDGFLKGTVDALAAIMEHANLLVNAITKLAAVWGGWKLWTVAQTTAMGRNIEVMNAEGVVQQRNVSAIIRENEARKQKQANLLREAALYRNLSGEERKYLANAGMSTGFWGGTIKSQKLTSKDYVKLVQNGNISQNEALRLAYIGKIDKKTLDVLRSNKLITKTQYQQVLHAREMAVSWLPKWMQGQRTINALTKTQIVLYRGMAGLMSGLGAIFSPANIAMMGIGAALTALAEYKAERDKMAQDAAQIAANAKENYEEIRKFIADNPIELVVKGGDDAAMKEMVKRYVEEIQKGVPQPLANNLVSSIYADENGKTRSLKDQVERARELAEAMSQAAQYSSEYNRLFIDAADKENGWFNDSMATNLKEAATEFQEFKSALYGLDKVKTLNALENEGLDKMGEEGKLLAEQLKDGKSSMEAIFSTVMKMYAKSEQYNKSQGGLDNTFHFDSFLDNSGLRNILDQYQGSFGTFGYTSAAEDVTEESKAIAERFKNSMIDAGINPMSDAGRIYAEQMKNSFFENAEVADEHIQNLFSFAVDSTLYGNQATAFKILGTELGGALTDGARQAVNDFKETGEWSMAMEAAVNEAKEKVISKYPELKDELEKAWQTPKLQVLISTELGAQQLDAWKKYMMDVLGDKYDIAIKMTTNVKEAQDAIQKVYDDARAFITKQKPLQVKLGVAWNTAGIKSWIDKNQYIGDQTTVEIMKQIYKAFQTVDEGKAGIDKGWIDPAKADKKDKPKKTGSQKDKYTEDLKRRYESFKKAITEYNKAIKSMGEAEAKALVKTVYGIELPDRYVDKYGGIALAEDFEKKNTKKTDAAKNFRETLRNDKTAATVQKSTDSYDALAEAQMEQIKITEKQYKAYDDLFKKTGDAKLSSIMAFGSETKPYNDFVEYMKNELVKMGDTLKTKGVSFDELLKLSPQDMENLPKQIQELFKKIQETVATGGEDVRKQLSDVFSKTDDLDIKLVLNENLRKELLDKTAKIYKDASPEDLRRLTSAINDFYDKAAADIKLEQFKRNINWELIFSDIESKSKKMLTSIRNQLNRFIKSPAYKELAGKDPKSARELVNKRDELDIAIDAKTPNLNIFNALNDFQKAQKDLEDALENQSKIENNPESTSEQKKTASEAVQTAQINFNKAQTELNGTQKKLMSVINTMTILGSTSENSMVQTGTAITELLSALGVIPSKVATIIQGILAILDGIGKQGLFDFVGNILGSVFEAIGGVFDGIGEIFGISGLGGIFHTKSETQEEYEEEKERHQELLKVWNTVIERLKEALEEGGSENYASSAEDIKNIYEKEMNAAKELGKQYLNAGASSGFMGIGSSPSHGREQRESITDKGWSELYNWYSNYGNGVDLSSITDGRMTGLFDLSVNQLKTLQEQAPYFWASLTDETRTYLEEVIEAGEKIEDLEDEIKKLYTSTTTDSIADSFASALDSMDDQTKTFANNFTKTLRNAIINAYITTAMKNNIQTFYDKMAEYAENDATQGNSIFTDYEWSDLQNDWDNISEEVSTFQQTLKKLGAYNDQTSGSLSGSIQNITEETGDLLASYVNAIRADVAFIRSWYVTHFNDNNGSSDTITAISVAVANIEANTRRSADNTDEIIDLFNAVLKTTTNGKAIRMA